MPLRRERVGGGCGGLALATPTTPGRVSIITISLSGWDFYPSGENKAQAQKAKPPPMFPRAREIVLDLVLRKQLVEAVPTGARFAEWWDFYIKTP